jgi:hypothetical protein
MFDSRANSLIGIRLGPDDSTSCRWPSIFSALGYSRKWEKGYVGPGIECAALGSRVMRFLLFGWCRGFRLRGSDMPVVDHSR